jgi:spore maturation protein CgeB
MKILFLDTYYPRFLADHYAQSPALRTKDYATQLAALVDRRFGTSDCYSRPFREMGHDAADMIVNCADLQSSWAMENHVSFSRLALRLPSRFTRLPIVGPWLARLPGLVEIVVEQIRKERPDILYCQDLWFLPPSVLKQLRSSVKLIVGQIASPLPPAAYVDSYDLILTSFPHFVPRIRERGVASEYFRIGFDRHILDRLGEVEKDLPVTFVGGISRHHGNALAMLEKLAVDTPISFFGYGAGKLSASSPILPKHRGEVWGLDMYRALARSRMTVNRHIGVAENNANNMRLYEATGVGTLLITDRKDNLSELFEIDKEVVVYSSPAEAVEKIQYYLQHPDEGNAIAKAGQLRTLRDHTYEARMTELVPILERHLTGRQ